MSVGHPSTKAVDPAVSGLGWRRVAGSALRRSAVSALANLQSRLNRQGTIGRLRSFPPGRFLHDRIRVMIEDRYPLSSMQLGMVFHTLREPETGVYVQQFIWRLREEIDSDILRRAWRRVVARHPALRTAFSLEGADEPQAEVRTEVDVPWVEEDWSAASEAGRQSQFAEFLLRDRKQGFDIAQAPLFRLTLLRNGPSDYCLVWTQHHALIDGRSRAPLVREVFGFYDAFRGGDDYTPPLAAPPLASPQPQDGPDSEAYWRARLEGFNAPTPLVSPVAELEPPEGGSAHAQQEIRLGADLTAALKALAADHGVTLNTLVQFAWGFLLASYGEKTDVVFGVTRTLRHKSRGDDETIGLLINTLPVRLTLTPQATVLSLLEGLRAQWLAMAAYEHTPLVRIQGWSALPRGAALFETSVMFDHQTIEDQLRAPGGDWLNRRFELLERSHYPVTLLAYGGPELRLKLDFERRRFDDGAAADVLQRLSAVLEAIASNPHRKVEDLPRLQQAFQAPRAVAHGDPVDLTSATGCVLGLFKAQAAKAPEAVAVVWEHERLTYGGLDARAETLARNLQSLGVRPGDRVALFAERSPSMIAGLLGVMKAGAVYVPIDPSYPADRVAHILADSGATTVLAQTSLLDLAPPRAGVDVVCLEALEESLADPSGDERPTGPAGGDLAYLIYTSGSTGRPKGVMVDHANLEYSTLARLQYYRAPVDGYLLLSSIAFDSSLAGIFWALCSGGRLVLPEAGAERDPARLATIIETQQISHLLTLPSLYRLILEAGGPNRLGTLRVAVVAGEACPVSLAVEHRRTAPAAAFFNEYGPTEATVWSTVHEVRDEPAGRRVPIGRPIPGAWAYVIADGRLAALGEPGELYMGGPGVALGYLDQADLTADRFVPDTFGGEPGQRLYRTGDLACMLPGGLIDFLGRTDQQVKIRGHRVELGEVEQAICGHFDVREAAVVLRDDVYGGAQLAAYVTLAKPSDDIQTLLRDLLRSRLPSYMIPATVTVLEAFPSGPNGKLDRNALPMLKPGAPQTDGDFNQPGTTAEGQVAAVWRDLLGLKSIGLHDNFFDLGGDSLTAIRAVSRISAKCGVALGVPEFYNHPTVRGLAALVERRAAGVRLGPAISVLKAGAGPSPFYFVHSGPQEIGLAGLLNRRPIFGVDQPWSQTWLKAAAENRTADLPTIEEMAAPMAAALRAHAQRGPCVLAGHSTRGLLAFELARQFQSQGGRVDMVVLFDTWNGYPSPRRVALHEWRQALAPPPPGTPALDQLRLYAERAAKFAILVAQTVREMAREGRNALWPRLGLQIAKAGAEELTSVFDEHGKPQLWGAVEPIFTNLQRTYVPAPLPCRGVLFTSDQSEDTKARRVDSTLGWRGMFTLGLDIIRVPADHYFVSDAGEDVLARALNGGLVQRPSSWIGERRRPRARAR